MPIINNLLHEPVIKEIEKEEELIYLLKEVRSSIGMYLNVVNITNPDESLKDILKIVEQGKYESRRNARVDSEPDPIYRIDLSKAKDLITQYRHYSEGGCQSCTNLRKFHSNMETYTYCNVGEDESSVVNPPVSNQSKKVEESSKTGCEYKKFIFSKTIEEILKDHKNE